MTPEAKVRDFAIGDRVRVLRVDGAPSVTARCPFESLILDIDGGYCLVQEPGVGTWRVHPDGIEAIVPQVPLREEVVKRQILSLIRRDPDARRRLLGWLDGQCESCGDVVEDELDLGEEGQFCASCIESMVEEVKGDRKFEESRA